MPLPAWLDAASLVPGAILAFADAFESVPRYPFALSPRPLELQTVPGPGADEDDDDDDDDDSSGGDEGNIEPDDEEGYDEDDGDDDDDEEPLRVTAWDLS
jgi:hypothetical protein